MAGSTKSGNGWPVLIWVIFALPSGSVKNKAKQAHNTPSVFPRADMNMYKPSGIEVVSDFYPLFDLGVNLLPGCNRKTVCYPVTLGQTPRIDQPFPRLLFRFLQRKAKIYSGPGGWFDFREYMFPVKRDDGFAGQIFTSFPTDRSAIIRPVVPPIPNSSLSQVLLPFSSFGPDFLTRRTHWPIDFPVLPGRLSIIA